MLYGAMDRRFQNGGPLVGLNVSFFMSRLLISGQTCRRLCFKNSMTLQGPTPRSCLENNSVAMLSKRMFFGTLC